MKNILKKTSAFILGTVMITGTANALPNYKVNDNISIPQFKLDKNTFVSDYKSIDINGDKIKDNLILTGVKENKNDIFFNDINVIFQNGKTKKIVKTSMGKYSCGYQPKMFLGDFNGDKVLDVLVSMPTGGSSGMVDYKIVSFKADSAKQLPISKAISDININFLPNFKIGLEIEKVNKIETLDLSGKKDDYFNIGVYDKNGNLKQNADALIGGFCELKPVVNEDGTYKLVGYQRVCGSCNADLLGYLVITLKWDGKEMKSDLNNVQFQQIIDEKQADFNGDGVEDYLQLSGMKKFGDNLKYITDIKLDLYDGKTYKNIEVPLKDINEGYDPKLVISDVNKDKSQDILLSIYNGGTSRTSTYSLISLKGNKAVVLFDREFNLGLNFDVKFINGFKADIFVKKLNKSYSLDMGINKEFYIKDGIYNKAGKLLRNTYGMMNCLSELKVVDVDKDGKCEIVGYQRVCGLANSDTLGYVKSTWKVDNLDVKLVNVSVVNNIEK